MGARLLPRHYVDEEVEHVRLGEGSSNITALKCPSFVVLGVDPGTHGQLGDEDVATFGKEDGRFCRDHLDLGIRLHDLLDTSQWKLVDLEIMLLGLEVVDGLLPVGG